MGIGPCASDVWFPYLNSTVQVSQHVIFLMFVYSLKGKQEDILTFYSVLKVYARGQNFRWWMINLRFWTFCIGSGEQDTEGWVVSSESCSFQSIGAK